MFRNIESFPAGKAIPIDRVLAAVPFDANGLIAAIAQQFDSGEVLRG
jgi:phosphoribosyl-AMP cyclohydrolase